MNKEMSESHCIRNPTFMKAKRMERLIKWWRASLILTVIFLQHTLPQFDILFTFYISFTLHILLFIDTFYIFDAFSNLILCRLSIALRTIVPRPCVVILIIVLVEINAIKDYWFEFRSEMFLTLI